VTPLAQLQQQQLFLLGVDPHPVVLPTRHLTLLAVSIARGLHGFQCDGCLLGDYIYKRRF